MKRSFFRVLAGSLVGLLLAVAAFAQDDDAVVAAAGDKYVISAKAGGVNYIEGRVAVARKNGKSGYLLKGDTLEIGDRVSTGTGGKAEILLNPGSYLRLGENSSFEFQMTSLDDLQVKLHSGSAMFEVFAANEFRVTINTSKTEFQLVESGIYRVDVLGDGGATLAVWKGKALIGNSETAVVRGGREATVSGSRFAVVKFDRDDKDELETWSKVRARELAKISANLKRNNLRNSLINSFYGDRWSLYDSFGLWVYDPFWRSYCFLPFGYGWYSPYGYGFGHSIWWYKLPRVIYQAPPGNGGDPVTPTVKPGRSASIRDNETPPFIKMQGSGSKRGAIRDVPLDNPSFPAPSAPLPPVSIPSGPTKPGRKP